MKALSHLKFNSLLDVGGAEGYKAYIAKKLFGVKVINVDLSEEACKRAEDIFNVESKSSDIQKLPFKNNEFDVVLCSATLEHVANWEKAVNELLRIAKNAVVITVPHETQTVIDKNIEEELPHAHIHRFDLNSFNYLKKYGYYIFAKKIYSSAIKIPFALVEAQQREHKVGSKLPKVLITIYNSAIPILKRIFGKRSLAFLFFMDDYICKYTSTYKVIMFIFLKEKKYWTKKEKQKISVNQILNITVPYYYMKNN